MCEGVPLAEALRLRVPVGDAATLAVADALRDAGRCCALPVAVATPLRVGASAEAVGLALRVPVPLRLNGAEVALADWDVVAVVLQSSDPGLLRQFHRARRSPAGADPLLESTAGPAASAGSADPPAAAKATASSVTTSTRHIHAPRTCIV